MDEVLRRQYLAAMGIQGWVRRLPGDPDPRSVMPAPESEEPQRGTLRQTGGMSPACSHAAAGVSRDSPADLPLTVPAESGAGVAAQPRAHVRGKSDGLGWDALRQRVLSCTACALAETRTQAVFGVGDEGADLLIIGEAPGADEDRQGEPFVGRAGQLLNAMLKGIGLARGQVYIANILKCRPPGNRDPRPEEALCCEPFLSRQIDLIAPRVILSVGRISAQNLLKTDTPVGRLRGQVHAFGASRIPLVVTYHPAYLLRSPEQKAKAWQDLLRVLAILRSED